eukprot:NODE_7127_length_460_cov_70.049383.p1 GENE.NODE_7127_length_460_cov_70.049383~~NODE_7127_length_460_cov_70.049383.p1  ORF type:complete len:101 (-),score=31.46 NODE_7127_length_460_cov_70.049383:140-421(-)
MAMRAKRFDTPKGGEVAAAGAENAAPFDNKEAPDEELRKKRAARFGLPSTPAGDLDQEKKRQRLERFGVAVGTEEDKKALRAKRFATPAADKA